MMKDDESAGLTLYPWFFENFFGFLLDRLKPFHRSGMDTVLYCIVLYGMYVLLCCVKSCYAMLCSVLLCYLVICYVMWCMQCNAMPCYVHTHSQILHESEVRSASLRPSSDIAVSSFNLGIGWSIHGSIRPEPSWGIVSSNHFSVLVWKSIIFFGCFLGCSSCSPNISSKFYSLLVKSCNSGARRKLPKGTHKEVRVDIAGCVICGESWSWAGWGCKVVPHSSESCCD